MSSTRRNLAKLTLVCVKCPVCHVLSSLVQFIETLVQMLPVASLISGQKCRALIVTAGTQVIFMKRSRKYGERSRNA